MLFLGSSRLCNLLREFNVNAEYFEVTVLHKGKSIEDVRFFNVNPLEEVDCIDRNTSSFEMETAAGYTDIISRINHLEIDETRATGHHFFLVAKCLARIVCVSDVLAKRIALEKITGVQVVPVSQWRRY